MGMVVIAALGAAREGEDATARLKAQRDQIEKLAAPLLKRVEILEKFKETAVDHEIAVARLTSDVERAKKSLQVRELSVTQYEQATFPSECQAAEGSIKLAESDLIKAKDRMEWSEKMRKAERLSDQDYQSAKLACDKALFKLDEAKIKLKVLTQFKKLREQIRLRAAVEQARSHQLTLAQKLNDLKEAREAAEKKLNHANMLSDQEVLILFRLRESIDLQNDDRLDEAKKTLDEAAELSRVAKERRARIHFEETEDRLKAATRTLRDRGPKATE